MTTGQVVTHTWESRRFESMYILQEKPNTHDTCTLTTSCTQEAFALTQKSWIESLLPRKRDPVVIHNTPVDWSAGPHPVSLPQIVIQAVEKVKHLLMNRLHQLLSSYLQHVISAFNTCSQGLTHQSLINTYGGYHLGGVDFWHHSPCSFQLMILHFSLMASSDLKLTSAT
jgi:hypothetical protein